MKMAYMREDCARSAKTTSVIRVKKILRYWDTNFAKSASARARTVPIVHHVIPNIVSVTVARFTIYIINGAQMREHPLLMYVSNTNVRLSRAQTTLGTASTVAIALTAKPLLKSSAMIVAVIIQFAAKTKKALVNFVMYTHVMLRIV